MGERIKSRGQGSHQHLFRFSDLLYGCYDYFARWKIVMRNKCYLIRIDNLPLIEADSYELTYSHNGIVKTISGTLAQSETCDTKHDNLKVTWLSQKILNEM